jgi:hypothetical protein
MESKDPLVVSFSLKFLFSSSTTSLKPAYPWSLLFLSGKSCGVQLCTQGLLTPVTGADLCC